MRRKGGEKRKARKGKMTRKEICTYSEKMSSFSRIFSSHDWLARKCSLHGAERMVACTSQTSDSVLPSPPTLTLGGC